MPDRIGQVFKPRGFKLLVTQGAIACLAVSMLLATLGSGWPQAAPQPSPGVQPPAPEPPPPAAAPENPRLINEIGKLWEKSKSMLPPLKSPGETIDDLNTRA